MSFITEMFKKKEPAVPQKRSLEDNTNVRIVGQQPTTNVNVRTPEEALKSSVLYRGISVLSDTVASTPIDIFRKGTDGYWKRDEKHPLHSLLTRRPSVRYNIYEMMEYMIWQLYMYGNAYIYVRMDSNQDPTELVLLTKNTCVYNELTNTYIVNDPWNKVNGTFDPRYIIHIKNKSLRPFVGQSILDFAGRSLGLAQAADKEASKTVSNGGKLRGIVAAESSLTGFGSAVDSQVDTIRDNMLTDLNSGMDIIAMQSGAKFTPISQTINDLQLIDLKTLSLGEIFRFTGVSACLSLVTPSSGNYLASKLEFQQFYALTFNPLLMKIENAFNAKLLTFSESKKYKISFERYRLTFADALMDSYKARIDMGVTTINEVRNELLLAPVEGGDTVMVSTNTQPLNNPVVDPVNEEPDTEINNTEENKDE